MLHLTYDKTIQSLKLCIIKRNVQLLFNILKRCHSFHHIRIRTGLFNKIFIIIILILNLAYDFLQDIFHSN